MKKIKKKELIVEGTEEKKKVKLEQWMEKLEVENSELRERIASYEEQESLKDEGVFRHHLLSLLLKISKTLKERNEILKKDLEEEPEEEVEEEEE